MSTAYTELFDVDAAYGEGTAANLRLLATVAQVEQVRAEHGSGWWTRRHRDGVRRARDRQAQAELAETAAGSGGAS